MEKDPLKIGIIGLGTVGLGVIDLLTKNIETITLRAGREIKISGICAKRKNKKRNIDLSKFQWISDPLALSNDDETDVIVELIGGEDGVAKSITEKALLNNKHVVTANKALIAHHGHYLALLAEEQEVALNFEAAVAGGIPIIKILRESLSGNEVSRVYGVINGTCNYILTQMENDQQDYSRIFKQAQDLGFVEKDPSLDVGGIDSAHKIAILASLAFGSRINFDNVLVKGIESISLVDIKNANAMGYRVKLLGLASKSKAGISQEVEPCLVPRESLFGKLDGGTNMVMVEGNFVGQTHYIGPGAGAGPTASSIISDLIDIAKGNISTTFGQKASQLKISSHVTEDLVSSFYMRFLLTDKPGTLAQLAGILGKYAISINRMRQLHHQDETAPVLIVTHPTQKTSLKSAIEEISTLEICKSEPVYIRIEDL